MDMGCSAFPFTNTIIPSSSSSSSSPCFSPYATPVSVKFRVAANRSSARTFLSLQCDFPESLSSLISRSGGSISNSSPGDSLKKGRWVKLICGASFEDLADVRNLSLVYTLAGVDCIDCAAESSVVAAVEEGINAAISLASSNIGLTLRRPWIMVSVNDDEDPHFRKAEFDPRDCPSDCSRPCERVCPASAIPARETMDEFRKGQMLQNLEGVIKERCYGCGRCLTACPLGLIGAKTYVRNLVAVSDLLNNNGIDAVEIHTSARHLDAFMKLWKSLEDSLKFLKLIAVSLPDLGDSMLPTMMALYKIMEPSLQPQNLWQLDGRPMSGDIGVGVAKAAVDLAARVVANKKRPPGFIQLAGGTNKHTLDALKGAGLFMHEYSTHGEWSLKGAGIAGIAYGGYARKIVGRVLKKMYSERCTMHLELYPNLLQEALEEAITLAGPLKGF